MMDGVELRLKESLCTQEEAPACMSSCPLHVDVRMALLHVANGAWQEAWKVYKKTAALPELMCRICDAPCQAACRLSEIGDGIDMRKIEIYLMEKFSDPEEKIAVMPEKKKSAAIIGADLDGLFAAYDLRRKGYTVALFCANHGFGGALNCPAYADQLQLTRAKLEKMKIAIQSVPEITRADLSLEDGKIKFFGNEYLCAYISRSERNSLSVRMDDEITRASGTEGVFSGNAEEGKWAEIAADGRRAGISMDRFMQRVSLTASRDNEGAYPTKLYTSLEGVRGGKTCLVSDAMREEEIIAEAKRCIQCACMECAKKCAFIQHYESYPRVYLRQMYNTVLIVTGLRQKNTMINSCSVCGQCESICPNHLNFQDIVINTRRTMVKTNKMPPSAFDFAERDMEFSNSDKALLARNPIGASKTRFAFFPGCQLGAANPGLIEKAYDFLCAELKEPVGIFLRCCGAIAHWSGNEQKFNQAKEELLAQLHAMGDPELIVSCPTCLKTFREFYPEIKARSLFPMLENAIPESEREPGMTLAIHDPCAARYDTETQDAVRRIARKMGVTLEELPYNREKTPCCSYGGNAWNANRELSDKAIAMRIGESATDYLTYCAMCQDFFLSGGKRTHHILDIIFHDQEKLTQKPIARINYSMRHENRNRLKRALLRKYWREEMAEPESYEKIKLYCADEVRRTMEDRLILVEDVQRVIEYAEKSGRKMKNAKTGHFLAHHNPVVVTYWVEYLPKEDGYEVFAAYSHRMFLEETNS